VQGLRASAAGQVDYYDERLPRFGIRVSGRGRKSWIVLYRHAGRVRRLTLGPYPALGLADARALAKDALRLIALGRDPAGEEPMQRRAETFEELTRE